MTDNQILINDISFDFVCEIRPGRDTNGKIVEFMPQPRYKHAGTAKLNPNGHGPFCRFKTPNNFPFSGVYAVTVLGDVTYVGECINLSARWGLSQYGSIQPANCYVGGQSVNCKVNHLILECCKTGCSVKLWFHRAGDHKDIEHYIIKQIRPAWNSQCWDVLA